MRPDEIGTLNALARKEKPSAMALLKTRVVRRLYFPRRPVVCECDNVTETPRRAGEIPTTTTGKRMIHVFEQNVMR